MRYLVIHSKGYGGQGPWYVNFELEAESPDAPVGEVFLVPGGNEYAISDVETLASYGGELTAGDVAIRTGGQSQGILAEKETGMVVFESGSDPDFPYPWEELNAPPLEGEEDDEEDDEEDTESE